MSKLKTQILKLIIKFWPVLIIFGLVVAFAWPYWSKNRVPFPADYLVDAFPPWQYFYGLPVKNNAMPDVISQMYPWKHLVIGLWKKGEVPLWNPYNFSGNPLLGNYQSAVFHPANFLFFLLPEIEAWSLMILLQPLLAGWFTYLFCRQLKFSQLASLLSSMAFMFCGFITVWMAYGTLSWALLWLPLALYALAKSFKNPSFFSLVLISISLAASFFSGHFQTSLYVLLAALLYLLFNLIITRKKRAFLLCLAFMILGIFIAAVQIFPTLELHKLAVRSKIFGISEIVPWSYTVTLLAPDFYGNPITRNDWFGHYAEWSGFVGVIPFVLAIYALLKKKEKLVWFFAFVFLLSLVLSRPTPLLGLIVKLKVPVLANSAAARINGLLSFSVAILAGFGFQKLAQDLGERKFKPALLVSWFVLLLFLVVWLILLLGKPFGPDRLLIAKRNLILPTGLAATFGGLICLYTLIQKIFNKRKSLVKAFLVLVLLVLVFLTTFDIFRFASKWMPFDRREHVYPQLPILNFLDRLVGPEKGDQSPDRLFGFFGMEVQNFYQIPGFDGYDPLYIQRYGELLMAARNGQIQLPSTRGVGLGRRDQYTEPLVNLLGGKYFLHAVLDDQECWEFNFWDYPGQFVKIYQDDKYEVYENKKALPRAFIAYDYQVIQSDQAIVDRLLKQEIDLSKTLVLEEEPTLAEPLKPPNETPMVRFVYYRPNQVQLQVQTQTPGLLFLSDNYYPDWRAWVDDQEAKIYRADYAFRGLVIPSGEHQVKFIYQPNSFRLGVKVSFLSLGLVMFLASLFSWRLRK